MHLILSKIWQISRPNLVPLLKKIMPGPWTLVLLIAGLLMALVLRAIIL